MLEREMLMDEKEKSNSKKINLYFDETGNLVYESNESATCIFTAIEVEAIKKIILQN